MRRYLFNAGLIIWVLFICAPSHAALSILGDVELKKVNNKEYPCDKLTRVELSNKYGKIEVKTWDKSFVKIDATIIVRASSKSKAQEKLDEIEVSINKNANSIVAVTDINSSNNSSWWSSWWSGNNSSSIEINYLVQMPSDLHSIIENKYGNIYLPDLSGKTSINLKYGNLEAQNINNDLLMNISYGKSTVGKVNNLSGELAYSDYRGIGANAVVLTSKYSKVYLDNASNMTISSKYDEFKLGNINKLVLTGAYDDIEAKSINSATLNVKYSGVDIGSLGVGMVVDISYGSLTIDNLKTTLKNIVVNTSYAPIKIYGTVPAKVEINGKYCDTQLGADFIQKVREEENNSTHIKGYKISEKTSTTINITSKYGDIVLK